jgi:hypothetical protein
MLSSGISGRSAATYTYARSSDRRPTHLRIRWLTRLRTAPVPTRAILLWRRRIEPGSTPCPLRSNHADAVSLSRRSAHNLDLPEGNSVTIATSSCPLANLSLYASPPGVRSRQGIPSSYNRFARWYSSSFPGECLANIGWCTIIPQWSSLELPRFGGRFLIGAAPPVCGGTRCVEPLLC